jgi:hypothetical protein
VTAQAVLARVLFDPCFKTGVSRLLAFTGWYYEERFIGKAGLNVNAMDIGIISAIGKQFEMLPNTTVQPLACIYGI